MEIVASIVYCGLNQPFNLTPHSVPQLGRSWPYAATILTFLVFITDQWILTCKYSAKSYLVIV